MKDDAPAVLAFAGRLIDPPDSEQKRFPLENAPRVRAKLDEVFSNRAIALLISSAAAGADLLALDVARDHGTASLIVLPERAESFRRTSVSSRPGHWEPLFDSILNDAERRGSVIVVQAAGNESPYSAATGEIIRRARAAAAASEAPLLAVAAFEGKTRGTGDHTAAFLQMATEAGAEILSFINTLSAE